MASNHKKKQTKIDSFFKRMTNNQSSLEHGNSQKPCPFSVDDDIFVEKHIKKNLKRKTETRASLKSRTKTSKLLKTLSVDNVIEKFVIPMDAVLKVHPNTTNSGEHSSSPVSSFTKLKLHEKEPLKDEKVTIILPKLNHDLCEESRKVFSDEGNKEVVQSPSSCLLNSESELIEEKHREISKDETKSNIRKDTIQIHELFDGKSFHNFEVLSVERQNDGNLELKIENNGLSITCILCDFWSMTNVKVGDSVTILSKTFFENTVVVDKNNAVIVLNPDTLISSTSLSSAVFCMRKTWLNEKFVKMSSTNKEMFVGCIVHELFQAACIMRLETEDQLMQFVNSLMRKSYILDGCYANGVTIEQIMDTLQTYIGSIVQWIRKFVNDSPTVLTQHKMKMLKVHDIEDNFWCKELGLKGKVDLNFQVEIHENKMKFLRNIPLELKTGNASFSFEHEGQVLLYSMMMNETKYSPCDRGLLLYLKEKPQMKFVQMNERHRSSLIQLRNELVHYLSDEKVGPSPLNNERLCSTCDSLLPCSLMFKSFGAMSFKDSEVMRSKLIPKALNHLTEDHIKFFNKWVSLTHMEMSTRNRDEKAFWKENSIDREAKGLAFANLVIVRNTGLEYTFERINSDSRPLNTEVNIIRVGDRVAVSEDKCLTLKPRIAFAIGFVNKVEETTLELRLEKKLDDSFSTEVMRVDFLKVDKTFSQYLTNVVQLMLNEKKATKLRHFIIDGVKPKRNSEINKRILPFCQPVVKSLNTSQQEAVLRSVTTEDYTLICGTPGAGKTTTIVSVVRVLASMNKSVLITSYTHAALDNILLKLKRFNINFLRLGLHSRIHPEIRGYSLEKQTEMLTSVEERKHFYSSISVVASTCLSINHPLFTLRTFEYCIMDEASQVNLLVTLSPLFVSKRFILVGDSKQLPPVVRNQDAKRLGFDRSLFSILSDNNTVNLTIQYRMNKEIMRIASELTYGGLLECASDEIAKRTLTKRENSKFDKVWFADVLDDNMSKSVIFVDTDQVPATEERDENGFVYNRVEANIVVQLIDNLLKNFEINSSEVGVVTPYTKQVEIIREVCSKNKHIEINTVDQYQGRDKDAILISTVLHSKQKNVKELLKDKRRLNVAITRARKKLIIVGSRQTLCQYEPFSELFHLLKEHQIYRLPFNAHL